MIMRNHTSSYQDFPEKYNYTTRIRYSFFLIYTNSILTHCGLVTPFVDIDLGQHLLREWLVAWSNVEF